MTYRDGRTLFSSDHAVIVAEHQCGADHVCERAHLLVPEHQFEQGQISLDMYGKTKRAGPSNFQRDF